MKDIAMTATTTTTYQLRAVTDDSISKVHLGAVEKANRTWCGVDLLVKDDPRFGGRYKDIVYTASADLTTVNCGACKRSAAWKNAKDGTYTTPAPKAARPRAAADHPVQAAADAVSGSSVIEPDPQTGLPRIKPDVAAKAEQVVAAQKARNGKAGR